MYFYIPLFYNVNVSISLFNIFYILGFARFIS